MPLKVLYVEDDFDQFDLAQEALQMTADGEVIVNRADSEAIARQMVKVELYDLIMVDYRLSSFSKDPTGLDLISWLVDHGIRLPMMLVSSSPDLGRQSGHPIFGQNNVSFLSKSDLGPGNIWPTIRQEIAYPLNTLIISDDRDDREAIADHLANHHYFSFNMRTTGSLENARIIQQGFHPDVFIIDYMIGAHSSLNFIQALVEEDPASSVILLAEHALFDDRKALRLIGHRQVSFLSKPALNTETLIDAIKSSRNKMVSSTPQLH